MQTLATTSLVLLSAHLVTDFVFPRDQVLETGKEAWTGWLKHGLAHYLTASLLAGFVQLAWFSSLGFQLGLVGLTGAHLLLDWGGRLLAARDNVWAFLRDQLLHFGTIVTAAYLIAVSPHAELAVWLVRVRHHENKLLTFLVVYTGVIFGGGTLLRYAMRPLLERLDEIPEQLPDAGMYIGWLERFLVLTALVLQSPSTVGLILTAKSVVRYPELKSLKFAEYFLIGTLLSVSLAVVGGIILLKALGRTSALTR